MHQDLMRTTMTRQERMAAIEEEDQRLAREEVEQSQSAAAAGTKKRGKSVALASDGSDEDRQPTRKRTEKKGGDAPVSTTNKRSRAASRDPTAAPSSEDDESARTQRKKFKATGKTPAPTAAAPKNAKEVAALRKAEKEAKEKESAKLLQVKVTKRKNASADQAFNEDFNALKIVRPVLKAMPQVEKRRMAWDENDSDVERHDRLVQEDQERLAAQDDDDDMDPENWRKPTQAMFVIKTLDVVRKERQAPRTDVDERWAGMVNYKKFRVRSSFSSSDFSSRSILNLFRTQPKNAPRDPLAQRRQIELVVPESQDLGLGAGSSFLPSPFLRPTFEALTESHYRLQRPQGHRFLASPAGRRRRRRRRASLGHDEGRTTADDRLPQPQREGQEGSGGEEEARRCEREGEGEAGRRRLGGGGGRTRLGQFPLFHPPRQRQRRHGSRRRRLGFRCDEQALESGDEEEGCCNSVDVVVKSEGQGRSS